MRLLKILLNWFKAKRNRLFFKPIDATRHLNGDALGIYLAMNDYLKKLGASHELINEYGLWDVATTRTFFEPEEGWRVLVKQLKFEGVPNPWVIEETIDRTSRFIKQDGTIDATEFVRIVVAPWLSSRYKYVGVGVNYTRDGNTRYRVSVILG